MSQNNLPGAAAKAYHALMKIFSAVEKLHIIQQCRE
jgi:hypothetical protein